MATVKLDPAKGIQIPNLTTTERNAISSPETGAIIWNTTTSEINQYNGSAWEITYTDTSVAGITSSADATAITIDSNENVGIGVTPAMASSSYNGLHIGATYPTMKLSSTSSGHAATDGFHLRIDSTPRVEYWNYENTDQVFANNNGEKLRIQADGSLLVGTTDGGSSGVGDIVANAIFLGGNQAANELDDYEEGTFTMAVQDWSSANFSIGTVAAAKYTKVGNAVTIWFKANLVCDSGSPGGGDLKFTGWPFSTAGGEQIYVDVIFASLTTNQTNMRLNFYGNGAYLYCLNSSGNIVDMTASLGGTTEMSISFTYMTA